MTAKTLEEERRNVDRGDEWQLAVDILRGISRGEQCGATTASNSAEALELWATARDKEIEELRAKLASMREPIWMLREEHGREIEELRARVKELET